MSAKRVLVLSSLISAILFAQDVSATLLTMLPESSHYQGIVGYNKDWVDGFGNTKKLQGSIEFAVYDTQDEDGDEFAAAGFDAPGDGQYIYAYQIFNDWDFPWWKSEESVAYFAALGIDMNTVHILSISSLDDQEIGIEPTKEHFSDNAAVWEFGFSDEDLILAGEHSRFLVYRSKNNWIEGEYEIRGPANDFPVPEPDPAVPEPAMLTLFSIGGAMLLRRGKNNFGRTDN